MQGRICAVALDAGTSRRGRIHVLDVIAGAVLISSPFLCRLTRERFVSSNSIVVGGLMVVCGIWVCDFAAGVSLGLRAAVIDNDNLFGQSVGVEFIPIGPAGAALLFGRFSHVVSVVVVWLLSRCVVVLGVVVLGVGRGTGR